MEVPTIAWVLNLGAEDELEQGTRYPGPDAALAKRIAQWAGALGGLVRDGDLVVPLTGPLSPNFARDCVGRTFCPTPFALERLRLAGAQVPRAPSLEVLRRVNHRAFNAELGQTLEGATYVWTKDTLNAVLSAEHGTWVLKRPFGYAGRGQRRVVSTQRSVADEIWIQASLESGEGLQVEPWLTRVFDCGLHGYLEEDQQLTVGAPAIQVCNERGAWISTHLAGDELNAGERAQLWEELTRTAEGLGRAGYFGPFGIDAFRYRDQRGQEHFRARSEINARYSMGWAIGMRNFQVSP